MTSKPKVLITGAAGRIGQHLTAHWRERYDLVLTDQRTPDVTHGFPFARADLARLDDLEPLFTGVHTVIHLGADASTRAAWESLLGSNIVGVYNVLECARQASCQRVVFASSVNAVRGYPADVQVNTHMPVAPPNLYGASKAWGEAAGRFYADARGLSVFCLRIGALMQKGDGRFKPDNPDLDIALTYGDLSRLFDACMNAPLEVRFGIFHGISDNRFKRLDLTETIRILGYAPQDDAFVLAGMVGPERPDHLYDR